MKLLLTLLTGLTLSASLPALAETTTKPDANGNVNTSAPADPDAAWHGHGRHHRRHCGPFGRFWCDVSSDTDEAQLSPQ